MTRRSRRLADQLDAALDGHRVDLPAELAPLVAIADAIREAAGRTRPHSEPAPVRIRIEPHPVPMPISIRVTHDPGHRSGTACSR
jgi:hypothetical protein